jgi:hypothetical protein
MRATGMLKSAMRRKFAISALLCLIVLSSAFALPPAHIANEIQRGFTASGKCFRGGVLPSQWRVDFQRLLYANARVQRDTDGFLLGANFGFSFRVESLGEGIGAQQDELRQLAVWAAMARLSYEEKKKTLRLSDAEIVRTLGISEKKFADWKARNITGDTDRSVLKDQRGLGL